MITKFDKDQGTFILPITGIEYPIWERLNTELGAYVIAEIDYETDTFTKVDVDYSLIHYDDLKYAKQELDMVYDYVKEYLSWEFKGVSKPVDPKKWQKESKEYFLEETA